MPRIHLVTRAADGAPSSQTLDAPVGQSVMRIAVDAGIAGIAADCGGMLTCATCHVHVAPEWLDRLPPAGDEELAMLGFTAAPQRDDSRLACQLTITEALDGLTVELPDRQY